jgi:tryptophan synthase alpha chain
MSRVQQAFERLRSTGQTGLVAYLTAGDPDLARSAELVRAVSRAGADVLEVGVPFSDPVADGPVIQRASERALAAGSNLAASLDLVAGLRPAFDTPVVLFTYVNPVLRMGVDAFVARATQAGVDGVLVLDLPIEESEAIRRALDRDGIDLVFLVSPTTADWRLREAARLGRGFLYAISRLGVTGPREAVAASARPLVERIRAVSGLPVALGFGISTPEQVREAGTFADAAVVGSALVDLVAREAAGGGDVAAEAGRFVRWLKGH